MSIPILQSWRMRTCKPKLFGFTKFCDPGSPINPFGPFRDTITRFLEEFAVPEDYTLDGMPISCTLLMHQTNFFVPLYIVQEDGAKIKDSFCNHCRSVGWGKHLTKRSYHIIIPIDADWNKPLNHGALVHSNHLLHGVIHANGFGHLLCIKGIEGGSRFLTGREIMDLWDRICTILQARKISLEDNSKKRSMDLRLLYGVAYGHTWFGRWNYSFFEGSSELDGEQTFNQYIQQISSVQLELIDQDSSGSNKSKDIKTVIKQYADMSEGKLTTLRDLLRFMLNVMKSKSYLQIIKNYSKSKKALSYKKQEIADALLDNKARNTGMTIQAVRDAARAHIDDVYNDLVFIYSNVLLKYDVQSVLDSKHFVKEWPFPYEQDQFFEGEQETGQSMKCVCGAEDDDGERMVSCEICQVCHHTRCYGIEANDSVPPLFVCSGCCGEI